MGLFGGNKIDTFSEAIIEIYSFHRKYGGSAIFSKTNVLKVALPLGRSFFHSKSIKILNELDFIDIIMFLLWFNFTRDNKFPQIIKVKTIQLDDALRAQVYNVAVKSGQWWIVKNDLRKESLRLFDIFNELGEALNSEFKLL